MLKARLAAALAALRSASMSPAYAVVYDTGPEDNPNEEYYEAFDTPAEARLMFREAYPAEDKTARNARLVLILAPIDEAARLLGDDD